jgi:uncharacterized protein YeaO (DUF488 family)
MTEKFGPGQRQAEQPKQENQEPPKTAGEAIEQGVDIQQRIGPDQTPQRADDAPGRAPVDARYDPFPDYSAQSADDLASLAQSRGVEIPRDVEKAQLIHELREKDLSGDDETAKQVEGASNPYASYDVMPLEELRKLADARDVKLKDEFRKAHLVSVLRHSDSSVAGTGVTVNLAEGTR